MSVFDKLWVEKYRPQKLDDVVVAGKTREFFEKLRGGAHIPHILLVSPPGRGKTTLAKIVARELVESEYLYVNASDENGIDTVRTKIKQFAETSSIFGNPKIVILDECDRMSKEGQDGLRNIFETFADNTRFILTANNHGAITDALESRCTTIKDFSMPLEDCRKRAEFILESEGVTYERETLENILKQCLPDFRKVVSTLQSNTLEGRLMNPGEVEESFKKLVTVIWGMVKNPKYEVEKIREIVIKNEWVFPSFEALAHTLHEHLFATETGDRKLQRLATLEIADFLRYVNTVMDKELSFYALLIKLKFLID